MREAIEWVRDALSSKALVSVLQHFLIKDGFIHASDGRMTVAHPFPSTETFCAFGPEMSRLVMRLPENKTISISLGEDKVTLSCGKLRGTIKSANPEDWPLQETGGTRLPMPKRMMPAFRQLRPFISDNAEKSWALCIHINNDTLYATNNIAVVAAPEIDLDGVNALVPHWAIDFILNRPGITHWSHGDGYLAFYWDNGAWMRTQLIDDTFPPQAEKIINDAANATWPVSDEWREAFAEVTALADRYLICHADRIIGISKSKNMEVERDIETPCGEEPSGWSIDHLKPVINCATHWQPDAYPNPAPFYGDGILGVIMGRRVDPND